MQDRAYVIAIVIVLAICCLGGLVAVTGYINSNPVSNTLSTGNVLATPLVIAINTDTPVPLVTKSSGLAGAPTPAAVPSPLGAFQTIVASSTNQPATPTLAPASVPSKASSQSVPASPTVAQVSCAGFAYCPKGGPADSSLGPTGNECPRNYIWGRVVDASGRGMANMRVHYQGPSGEFETVTTKAPPDPAGVYNIPTGQPGAVWTIWLIDVDGHDLSPHVNMTTQTFSGAGDCPTRRDFVQQK